MGLGPRPPARPYDWSAYGAGAYFFARVCGARRWHPASAGVLGAAVFAVLMLLVTFVHWDRLNHGDGPLLAAVAFYGWVGVYLIAPALAGVPWLRNQRTDPRAPAPGEPLVPLAVRRGARAFAAGALLAAAIFLLWPSIAVAAWPWELTPLTARILGCFTAQIGLSALVLSLDERWSAWRLVVQTFLVATALLLAGAVRAFGDFDQGNPLTWCYLVGLLGTALGLLALYRRLERQHMEP